MKDDIGPAIGFILVALVAFLILISVGTNGRAFDIALNEMYESFGKATMTPDTSYDRFSGLKEWTNETFSKSEPTDNNFSCVSKKSPEYAELLNVIDGDTITVRLSDGSIEKVRYIGVNTAEEGANYYEEGKRKNNELVSSSNGILVMYKDKSDTDKYGRLLRYVFAGSTFVNYELVNSGLASAMTIAPDISCSSVFEKADHYIGK